MFLFQWKFKYLKINQIKNWKRNFNRLFLSNIKKISFLFHCWNINLKNYFSFNNYTFLCLCLNYSVLIKDLYLIYDKKENNSVYRIKSYLDWITMNISFGRLDNVHSIRILIIETTESKKWLEYKGFDLTCEKEILYGKRKKDLTIYAKSLGAIQSY